MKEYTPKVYVVRSNKGDTYIFANSYDEAKKKNPTDGYVSRTGCHPKSKFFNDKKVVT